MPVEAQQPSAELLALQSVVRGRYSLDRELGRGGMGIVLLARDVALDRLVAIKLLPPSLAAEPGLRERFLQEARTAAGLSHPNIVPIHAVEEHGNLAFFVMTFVDGETLRERVERAGPLRVSKAVRLIEEVAWALTLAHAKGIVHRDVKPDNIMIDKATGRAMVTDFGIARVADAAGSRGAGEVVGTAHYMSPEQALGEEVDARSDFYSLGATAFYALTGSLPFDAPTLPAIIAMHVNQTPPSMVSLRPSVPAKLEAAVSRCLAKDPRERFQSAEELVSGIGGLGLASMDVPPLVRNLMRTFASAGYVLMALGVAWVAVQTGDFWGLAGFMVIPLAFPICLAIRRLVRSGTSFDEVRAALTTAWRLRREERETVTGEQRRGHEAVRGLLVIPSVVLVIAAVRGIMNAASVTGTTLSGLAGLLGVGGVLLGILPVTSRTQWFWKWAIKLEKPVKLPSDRGVRPKQKNWLEILATHAGRLLFRVAGIGLKASSRQAAPPIEHTETVLTVRADSLYRKLPREYRRRLATLPDVMHRLERGASALRERGNQVTAARESRDQLVAVVAAQEQIRIGLIRLEGGDGSVEGLTGDLEAAQRLSEQIDALNEIGEMGLPKHAV